MWKSSMKVRYTSRSGQESIKTIALTTEGFAAVMDGEEEILFSSNGKPINTLYIPEIGGPSIKPLTKQQHIERRQPNGKYNLNNEPESAATAQEPWDNSFALEKLNIQQLQRLLSTLNEMGLGDQKLNLKELGKCAKLYDKIKIKKIFATAAKNQSKRGMN